jgi:hypothetical protein
MSLLWAVPPVAVVIAAGMALVMLRGISDAAVALQTELRRFSEVQVAVSEVRAAAADARATARGLRSR